MAFALISGGESACACWRGGFGALDLGEGLRVLVVAQVQIGQHARVQHAHDEDRFFINLREIEHVLPLYPPPVPGAHLVASAAAPRIFSEPLAAGLELSR